MLDLSLVTHGQTSETAPGPTGFKAGILWWCIRPHHLNINMKITQQILINEERRSLRTDRRRLLHGCLTDELTTDRKCLISLSLLVSNVQFWMQQQCARCCAKRCSLSILSSNQSVPPVWTQTWQSNELKSLSEGHRENTARSRSEPICPLRRQCHRTLKVEEWERTEGTALRVLKSALAQAERWMCS